jgi:hypothetical protein
MVGSLPIKVNVQATAENAAVVSDAPISSLAQHILESQTEGQFHGYDRAHEKQDYWVSRFGMSCIEILAVRSSCEIAMRNSKVKTSSFPHSR